MIFYLCSHKLPRFTSFFLGGWNDELANVRCHQYSISWNSNKTFKSISLSLSLSLYWNDEREIVIWNMFAHSILLKWTIYMNFAIWFATQVWQAMLNSIRIICKKGEDESSMTLEIALLCKLKFLPTSLSNLLWRASPKRWHFNGCSLSISLNVDILGIW